MHVNPYGRVVRRTQPERRAATQRALLAAARSLFGARGFAAVGIEELAREAGVTRGALYHHFESKEALFAAVFEAVERELMMTAASAAVAADPWDGLRRGCRAFLEAVSAPEMRRMVLLDAPAVLGWEKWRQIDLKYGLALLKGGLEAAMKSGQMRSRPVEPLAYMLLGAITEAAMLIGAQAADGPGRERIVAELDGLLEDLR